jgi:hypothetical protein
MDTEEKPYGPTSVSFVPFLLNQRRYAPGIQIFEAAPPARVSIS